LGVLFRIIGMSRYGGEVVRKGGHGIRSVAVGE
jgi:hypothetical protein